MNKITMQGKQMWMKILLHILGAPLDKDYSTLNDMKQNIGNV